MYDGAIGARGIHKLQNYGNDTPVYDNKACTEDADDPANEDTNDSMRMPITRPTRMPMRMPMTRPTRMPLRMPR